MSPPARAAHPLHVVVTCSNRKRDPINTSLRLGSVHATRPEKRFKIWTERLAAMPQPSRPALDMYAGEHWQVARTLPSVGRVPVMLWVCSAGYGLIPATMPIHSYAATFSAGEPDSVGAEKDEVGDWWQRHTTWSLDNGRPRSIAELVKANPHSTVVAVLSEAYQRACSRDLLAAAQSAASAERLAVIGPPGVVPDLADLVVAVTAALQPRLGGSLQALNVRAAAELLAATTRAGCAPTRSQLKDAAAGITPVAKVRRIPGTKLDDAAVVTFIRSHLRTGPASATVLLRRLRASGHSCEQSRFGALYAQVSGKAARHGR